MRDHAMINNHLQTVTPSFCTGVIVVLLKLVVYLITQHLEKRFVIWIESARLLLRLEYNVHDRDSPAKA